MFGNNNTDTTDDDDDDVSPFRLIVPDATDEDINQNTKELKLKYATTDFSKVMVNIQDLSGRLIYTTSFGNKKPGNYNEVVDASIVDKSGLYIVSLFVGNDVLNRKVWID